MKLITFAIPCYNSQDYMEHCVETILTGGDDVEIIIVDDGSKDNTAEIADRLEKENPGIVRAIHQPNGGHGEAVNTGIANAKGLYFKVVDSDDWVDEKVLKEIIDVLKNIVENGDSIDCLISNYVYDKDGATHKKVMRYGNLPKNQIFGWDDCRPFLKGHYILMHSVIYRTKLLRDCGLKLPAHTFYVDNLYVFLPLPYVKKMYYIDKSFYHYYIGREDQSVNEQVMISRIDQQIKVNKLMVEGYNYKRIQNRRVRNYMFNYLEIITVVSTVLLAKSGTAENLKKRNDLWQYIKNYDVNLFKRLRYSIMCEATNLPGRVGRKISVGAYNLSQKIVGFN